MTTEYSDNAVFRRFVNTECGGNMAEASRRLRIDYTHSWRMATGRRPVAPGLAKRIEQESGGRISRVALVWPELDGTVFAVPPASVRAPRARRRA